MKDNPKKPLSKQPKRGDDQDRITFNLPKSLKDKIKLAAKSDRRDVAPWLVIQLEQLLDEMEADQITPLEVVPPIAPATKSKVKLSRSTSA